MTPDAWLAAAVADATRRGLAGIIPQLEALAGATRRLRAAPWNEDASRDAIATIDSSRPLSSPVLSPGDDERVP